MLLKEPFDIKDHEYDQEKQPLDGKKFYRKYMSKSLPCVFRGEAKKEEFFVDLNEARGKDEIDKILGMNFKTAIGGMRKFSVDFPLMATKIKRGFSKSGQLTK